ncbi:reverse transcriptase domain-containing protein [Streptomyces sp. NPDC088748]|uniref:reverse transcriptase domain-containing protein n=1 Tax=Streptomyces sp. NPDC088748 TaxID=3365887 RepID=UPI00382FB780
MIRRKRPRGILSPLLANIALSVLDEHLHEPREGNGVLSAGSKRQTRRRKGLPTWRIVRYADDFAVMVHGTEEDTAALRDEIAQVLVRIGLRLSSAKTRIVHLSEGPAPLSDPGGRVEHVTTISIHLLGDLRVVQAEELASVESAHTGRQLRRVAVELRVSSERREELDAELKKATGEEGHPRPCAETI